MPWIFVCLMIANAVYFGWKFMEGTQPQPKVAAAETLLQGAPVQLLSERPEIAVPMARLEADVIAEAEPVVDVSPAIAAAPQCFSVGPFTADAGLQRFVGAMQAKGFVARVDKRKVSTKDYWVFVPAFTNRDRADEKLRELKARGIDGFVVKDGVFVNAISLNHFSKKELAQAFLEKMKAAGVAVEYREIAQEAVERWVYLAAGRSKANLRAQLDDQISSDSVLKRENAPCEE